jgi:hypothetical protein
MPTHEAGGVQINRGKAVVTMAKKDIHPTFYETASVRSSRRRIPFTGRKPSSPYGREASGFASAGAAYRMVLMPLQLA